MAGTPEGAERARQKRQAKLSARNRMHQAAKHAEAQCITVQQSIRPEGVTDGALIATDGGNGQQSQQFARGLVAQALPIAALTLTQAMTDKRSPWPVRVSAAVKVLEIGGITADNSSDDDSDEVDGDLAVFMEAGSTAVALRRSAAGAEDAEVIGPDPVPGQP